MSGLVFEKLTQALQAGQVWRLAIAADFFRIAAAAWPVKVRIMKAGRILGEMDGWQAGDFVRDVEFDAVEIEAGGIAQAVTVQIAGGGVGSDRVLGEVSIIDGARADTQAGKAFIFYSTATGAAGERPAVQFLNPAGSGKTASIKRILLSSSFATNIGFGSYATPFGAVLQKSQNKLLGGLEGVTECRTGKTSGYLHSKNHGTVYVQANGTQVIEFSEPVVIGQGKGLTMVMQEVGANVLAVAAEGIEE